MTVSWSYRRQSGLPTQVYKISKSWVLPSKFVILDLFGVTDSQENLTFFVSLPRKTHAVINHF